MFEVTRRPALAMPSNAVELTSHSDLFYRSGRIVATEKAAASCSSPQR